jgi:surface-adhesin protein E
MRGILAALLMLAASVAWAEVKAEQTEQLVKLAENKSWDFYIDRATMAKEGRFRIVSEIWDMKEAPKQLMHPDTRSMRATIEFDCQRGFFRGRKLTAYSGQLGTSQILREVEERDPRDDWEDAMMSMPGAFVVKLVCSQ